MKHYLYIVFACAYKYQAGIELVDGRSVAFMQTKYLCVLIHI